jgi:hypothetical protein
MGTEEGTHVRLLPILEKHQGGSRVGVLPSPPNENAIRQGLENENIGGSDPPKMKTNTVYNLQTKLFAIQKDIDAALQLAAKAVEEERTTTTTTTTTTLQTTNNRWKEIALKRWPNLETFRNWCMTTYPDVIRDMYYQVTAVRKPAATVITLTEDLYPRLEVVQ